MNSRRSSHGTLLIMLLCLGFSLIHVTAFIPVNFNILSRVNPDSKHIIQVAMYAGQILGAVIAPLTYDCTSGSKLDMMLIVSVLWTGIWYIPHNLHYILNMRLLIGLTSMVGVGYGSLFVGIALTIQELTPLHSRAYNFALLSGAHGGAFAICGLEILILNKITSEEAPIPFYSLNLPNLVLFIVGALLIISHCVLRRFYTGSCSGNRTGELMEERTLRLYLVTTRRTKIFLLMVLIFVGFVNIITFQTYNRCCLNFMSYFWTESVLCYGCMHVITCIYSMCTYRNWYSGLSPILTCIFVCFGLVIMTLTFWGKCNSETMTPVPYYWILVPVTGGFLGSGSAVIFIEGLTLVNYVWRYNYRYSLVILIQSLWAISGSFYPQILSLPSFLILTFIFMLLYVFIVPAIYLDLKSVLNDYIYNSTSLAGSVIAMPCSTDNTQSYQSCSLVK